MKPTHVCTPKTWIHLNKSERDDVGDQILHQLQINGCWTAGSTVLLQKSTKLLYDYDKLEDTLKVLMGSNNQKILLNPYKIFCYSCMDVRSLKSPNSLESYIEHIYMNHFGEQFGHCLIKRHKLLNEAKVMEAPTPFDFVKFENFGDKHLNIIRKYAIKRDLNEMNYVFFWANWFYQLNIIDRSNIAYQEIAARNEILLSGASHVNSWNDYPTIKMYSLKMYCSLPQRALELNRGAQIQDTINGVKTHQIAQELSSNLNHPTISEKCVRDVLPHIRRDSGPNSEYIITHLQILEQTDTDFVFKDDYNIVYPIVLTVDDLLLNPGSYIHDNMLYGFTKPIDAKTLVDIGLDGLSGYLESQSFINSVREYLISDYGNVMTTCGYTTLKIPSSTRKG